MAQVPLEKVVKRMTEYYIHVVVNDKKNETYSVEKSVVYFVIRRQQNHSHCNEEHSFLIISVALLEELCY